MKEWVCKQHEDVVLFSEEDKNVSESVKRLSIIPIYQILHIYAPNVTVSTIAVNASKRSTES